MSSTTTAQRLPNVLLIGTGEYTTGLVNGQPSNSDKAAGQHSNAALYLVAALHSV